MATALTGAAGALGTFGINTLLTNSISETLGFAVGTGLGLGINSGVPNTPQGNTVGCSGGSAYR